MKDPLALLDKLMGFGMNMKILKKLFGMEQKPRECPKLGRNDPCWCGSGKKYKRCHMESDMKKRSRILAASCTTRS